MTRRFGLFILSVCVVAAVPLSAAATDDYTAYNPSKADRLSMVRQLDRVCGWAGIQRLSDLHDVECAQRRDDGVCTAKVSLAVDGVPVPYNIEFAGKPRKLIFAAFYRDEPTPPPDKLPFSRARDRETVTDPKLRASAVTAVKKFNRHLRWHWVSGPIVRKDGRNLVVTYHTLPEEERKDALNVLLSGQPPLVSFHVSPRGAICGALYHH
jgi:hypothetical protein